MALPPLPGDALHVESIAALLADDTRHRFDLCVVDSTGSTNTDLMHDASRLPSGTVLAAEHQTAGRGRRGRTWMAPRGGSLAFSVLWKFHGTTTALSGLSLAVGVAAARALEDCGVTGIGLKWPNDLLLRQADGWAKLGGILIELAGEPAGGVSAVIGIGLNVEIGAAAGTIGQPVTDLAATGCNASRNALLAAMLRQLAEVLPAFAADGFAPLADDWNQRHAWRGQAVQLMREAAGAEHVSGIALGAAADGALLVETSAGVQRIVSGDVSLRIAPPGRPAPLSRP